LSITSKRIVVLPDIHCPNHEETAIKPILKFIKFYKPTILIQLGDFCDWDSVSSYDVHSNDDIVTIETEIVASNDMLDRIDAACGNKCRKIMLGGNHEARYAKFMANNGFTLGIRRMREFSSWDREYNLSKRGWEAHEYGRNVAIGKCVFTHGWFATSGAAKQMAECFPGRNVIFGHTHQHLIYGCMDENENPIESESIGTLSKFDLAYLNGKPAKNWIHSFLYIDMLENGTFSKHFVRIINGGFVEHGKYFDCSIF
jgi:predicted phosphodiesterase